MVQALIVIIVIIRIFNGPELGRREPNSVNRNGTFLGM
jgi:hypothetical protein